MFKLLIITMMFFIACCPIPLSSVNPFSSNIFFNFIISNSFSFIFFLFKFDIFAVCKMYSIISLKDCLISPYAFLLNHRSDVPFLVKRHYDIMSQLQLYKFWSLFKVVSKRFPFCEVTVLTFEIIQSLHLQWQCTVL